MGTREILLILVSFCMGLVCIHWIRLLDRYEREPFGKMALVTFLGGGSALMIALGLFEVFFFLGFHDFESLLGTLLVIGPVEELAKLIGLLLVLGIIRNELNEPADGIIYMACIALGFSLIENILYALHPGDEYLLAARFLVATPLHICFSTLMGLSFYIWLKNRSAFYLVLTGYLMASLSHGFYDLLVFNYYSLILLSATIILMYLLTRNLFLYSLSVSPYRLSLAQTIRSARAARAERVACPHCSDDGDKPYFRIDRISLWHCERCDYFSVSRGGLFRIFFHFAGILKRNARQYLLKDRQKHGDITGHKRIHIRSGKQLATFKLADLDAVLETLNHAQKRMMRSKWYLPNNLFRLDQPGVVLDYLKMVRDGVAALWKRLIFPFSRTSPKLYRPSGDGPLWHWPAFLIPELWYPSRGLWGIVFGMCGIYLVVAYIAVAVGCSICLSLGGTALVLRVASGMGGCRIYYRRYGKWP